VGVPASGTHSLRRERYEIGTCVGVRRSKKKGKWAEDSPIAKGRGVSREKWEKKESLGKELTLAKKKKV